MRLITKLAVVCILCTLFVCGGVSADSSPDSFCVELDGDIGDFQGLDLFGVCITDCDGNRFSLNNIPTDYTDIKDSKKIDLSGSGLNCDKPFKEVKLHLTLYRDWGFMGCYYRIDDFTLDVSDLVTKKKDEPYTVLLKADHSYQVGKADAVTIYDCNKNKLKHFSSTHDEGRYGSFSPSRDWFYAELDGDIGDFQGLDLFGVCITDCDGNQFALINDERDAHWYNVKRNVKRIDLSGSGLNRDKPFKEVKLHLTLYRGWGFIGSCHRLDDFTLDVSDLVTKKEDKSYSVLLKADHSYQVGKADAVTFYDCNKKHKLKHFSSTHDEGHYGRWDWD